MKTTFWQRYWYAAKYNFKHGCIIDVTESASILLEAFTMTLAFIAMLIIVLLAPIWWPISVLWKCGWRAYHVATYEAEALDKLMQKEKKDPQST